MILEDDYPLRFMLESMFRLWESDPLSFANGYDASAWLDQIEAGKMEGPLPEVALLDIRVPGPQGPEIAERMHRMPQTAHIAVVIMTAYRLDALEKDKIVAQGQPDGFVNKGSPIFDTLQEVLEDAIKNAKERVAAAAPPKVEAKEAPKEPAKTPAVPADKPAPDGGQPASDGARGASASAKEISEKPPAPVASKSSLSKTSKKAKRPSPKSQTGGKSSPGKSKES